MINLQWIGMGILLVLMGTLFTLLGGNIGSIISFLIAIIIVGYFINTTRMEKRSRLIR